MNPSLKSISLTGEMIKSHVPIIKLLRPKSTYISNSIHIKEESRTVTVRLVETKCWVFRHLHWVRIKPCRISREESASREYKPVSRTIQVTSWEVKSVSATKYMTVMLVTILMLMSFGSLWSHLTENININNDTLLSINKQMSPTLSPNRKTLTSLADLKPLG